MKPIPQASAVFLFERVSAASLPGNAEQEVREYRMILEALFRLVTKEEQRTFSNLYARTQFVFDRSQVPEEVQRAVNGLRIFTNRVMTGELTPAPFLPLARKTLLETIAFFSETEIPGDLVIPPSSLEEKDWSFTGFSPDPELVAPIKAMVQEVRENGLLCKEDAAGVFFMELPSLERNDLSYLLALVRPYDTIRIISAGRAGDSGSRYTVLPETQIVLEPDLLVDISELADCFTPAGLFPLNFLVKKLVPSTFSEAALKGNMVNAIFDAAIRKDPDSVQEVFRDAVADQVFQAASFGKETLNRIYKDISSNHWRNLLDVAAELKKQPVRIEPSFLSDLYGLQGRLDVMLEDRADAHRKEIIELKSGKPPEKDTWINHGMQVIGYNMLLKSAFGEHRRGSSAILYSAATQYPLRNVTSNLYMENRLLRVRNTVIAWLLQLAGGDHSCLARITPHAATGLPAFSRRDYEFFHESWSNAGPREKAWYHAFLSFTIREYLQAKSGMFSAPGREDEREGFAGLWLLPEEEKVRSFGIIRSLEFGELAEGSHYARFRIGTPQHHNFRAGDTVLLYPRRRARLEPGQQQLVKARLDTITPGELLLSLNNHQLDASYFRQYEEWVLEHDVYESTYWLCTRALLQVLRPEGRRCFRLMNGLLAPELPTGPGLPADPALNSNQQQILSDALRAKDYYLLQGPPGTGKTSNLLTRMAKHLYEEGKTTVIVAFTNRAVDEIAEKLDRHQVPYLRMGSRRAASEQQLRDLCRNGKIDEAIALIRNHRVLLSTVATMAARTDQWKAFGKSADTLIVDEASQLTEPQLLPLITAFPRFILIGDQNQLPPVVAQDPVFTEVRDPLLQELGLHSLRGSLFERMMRTARTRGWKHAYGMLTTHFRMHYEIAGLINHYYAGRLQCGLEVQFSGELPVPWSREAGANANNERSELPFSSESVHSGNRPSIPGLHRSPTLAWASILTAGRAVFIPSPHESTPRYHKTEAERVVSLLQYLERAWGTGFSPEKVGVITPWRTQIGLIRSLLPDGSAAATIAIDTVERFQGGENDIIIVSMAVHHPGQLHLLHSPGIFEDNNGDEQMKIEVDRKLLVTLSRARKQVILLGDERVLLQSPHYAAAIARMKRAELSLPAPQLLS